MEMRSRVRGPAAILIVALALGACFLLPASASAAECTDCHTAGGIAPDGSAHPVPPQPSWDPNDGQCTICHEFISFIPETTTLYQDPPHGPYWIDLGGSWSGGISDHDYIWEEQCWSCHSGSWAHNKPFGPGVPLSGTINIAGSDCAGCHTSGMSAEVPQVGASHGDVTASHADAISPECATCHGSNLMEMHADCSTCHTTSVTGETCASCHPAFVEPHGKYAGFSKTDQYVPWAVAASLASMNADGALMAAGPHAGYATTTIKCAVCHSAHRGGSRLLNEGSSCAFCHTSAYYGGGAVASNLISWTTATNEGPHANRCTNGDCHGGPHGVDASAYAGPSSRLLTSVADTKLEEDAAANGVAVGALAVYDDVTRALATGAVCSRAGCHTNSAFGVTMSGAMLPVDGVVGWDGADVGMATGHRVIADATTNWNANGTDFPSSRTNLTIAFKPVSYCASCHDLTDDNNGGKPAFPHAINGVVSVAQGADGTSRPAAWLTAAANAGEQTKIVGPYSQYTGDGATITGAAGSSIIDGVCLKCHRSAGNLRGIGIDDGAPLAGPVDTTPPVTTSDAVATYAGTATITLSPSDAGSGVAVTYYRINGGPQQTGTSVVIGAQGSYTLEFWSVDLAGNAEMPHNSVSFTVTAPLATLAFVWHPQGYAEAELRVENASGVTIASTTLSGTGSELDWYVPVVSGQNYRMVCDYYWDEWTWDEGGGYSVWSNDTVSNWGGPLNPDGVLSPGETVIWYY